MGTATRRCAAPKAASWHASLGHTAAATSCLVHLHHDRVHDALELLLLGFELVLLGQLVLVEPVQCLLHGLFDLLLVSTLEFILELFFVQSIPHCEAVVLQAVLGLNLHPVRLILGPELLSLL